MLHILLSLGVAVSALGTLGMVITEAPKDQTPLAHASSSMVSRAMITGGDLASCSSSVEPPKIKADRSAATSVTEIQFDEPFVLSATSLSYVDREAGAIPVQHFDFYDSAALKITAKTTHSVSRSTTTEVSQR